jgi:hypothetical protein
MKVLDAWEEPGILAGGSCDFSLRVLCLRLDNQVAAAAELTKLNPNGGRPGNPYPGVGSDEAGEVHPDWEPAARLDLGDTFSAGRISPFSHGSAPCHGPERPDKYAPIQPPDGLLHTQTKEVHLSNL